MRRTRPTPSPLQSAPMVGVVVDGVTGYGRAVMRGVMRYANLQRRWLLHEEMRHVLDAPIERWPNCDGAILAGVGSVVVDSLLPQTPHIIRVSGAADPHVTPVVSLDDYAVGQVAAQHLIDCRLEHFGFYGFIAGSRLTEQRFAGFKQTLDAQGFTCHEAGVGWPTSAPVVTHTHWPRVVQWLQTLPKPVGVMAIDDGAARELAAACLQAGISVPERVAIVGVNNDDLLCDSAWPPLSSVEGDYSRAGYIAAEMLDRLLNGEKLEEEERFVQLPPLGVVRRQSTDVLAVDDPSVAEAVRYIREHACDPCSVGDILRHVPVGRRWLERQFQKKLGRNPHDEIMRIRIESAKRLLLQRELSIPEIARRCGFAAVQNFGRAFQQSTETTPGAFRRQTLRAV